MIKDVTDYFAAGGTEEDLVKMAEAATEYAPPPKMSAKVAAISSNGSGLGTPHSDPCACSQPPPSGLPQIYSRNRLLREIVQENLSAMRAANDPPKLYVRSGRIAHVIVDE